MNTKTFESPGWPISWECVREVVRARFLSGSHWLAVFDRDSRAALDKIQKKFFWNDRGADLDVMAVSFFGQAFWIACMRKSKMPARKYRKLLDRFGVRYETWDMVAQDGALIVTPWRMLNAIALIDMLREKKNELALES